MSIPVICKTNLDLFNETWPETLPCRPMVGDYIESETQHPQYKRDKNGMLLLGGNTTNYVSIQLEVVSVTFKSFNYKTNCFVELHDKRFYKRNIYDFYKWYAPIVGKSVSYFI